MELNSCAKKAGCRQWYACLILKLPTSRGSFQLPYTFAPYSGMCSVRQVRTLWLHYCHMQVKCSRTCTSHSYGYRLQKIGNMSRKLALPLVICLLGGSWQASGGKKQLWTCIVCRKTIKMFWDFLMTYSSGQDTPCEFHGRTSVVAGVLNVGESQFKLCSGTPHWVACQSYLVIQLDKTVVRRKQEGRTTGQKCKIPFYTNFSIFTTEESTREGPFIDWQQN